MLESFRAGWLVIVTTLICIYGFAQLLSGIDLRKLLLPLGAVVFLTALVQLIGLRIFRGQIVG